MEGGQRKHVRVPARIPCDVLAQARAAQAQVLDLSVGGAMLELDDGQEDWLPVGAMTDVAIALDGQQFRLSSVVVRQAGPGRIGVAFQGLGRAYEVALARFVQQQERKLLRTHLHLQ